MSELLILLAQFLGALFAVLLAGMILAKLHLLPAVLYAVLRWALWIYRWRQEERAARGYLLATARPMYEITEDGEYIPIRYDDG